MMTKEINLEYLGSILENVTNNTVEITEETHLIDNGVVDSLDSAVFLLEVEKKSGVKLSDKDIEELDLFNVANMLTFLKEKRIQS